ncbi:TSUP family transporter [Streptomyces sp. NPDC050423]|uniref:TSUP family transporter n=1 Tax=Streptomyces sp. NPDC050423 TaxID=3155402 RepID=UPI003432C679
MRDDQSPGRERQPLPRAERARRIADTLRQRITSGLYEDGMLPDERALGHVLGTTRNTVREALGLLRDEGLITRRRGIGTRIVTVAVAAGLFGLGGPMLSVPLLVVCGLPVLSAPAAAQAQSVVIASVGTIGYVQHGSVDWTLAAVVGVPELVGVIVGWRIARSVPDRRLKYALVGMLLAPAPYLAFHS